MANQIGIILLARMSSRRLPGKALRQIEDKVVLGHILDRVRLGAGTLPIVVATSTDADDDPIEEYCRRTGVECFRGSLDNVAERFVGCAEHHGWDFAVRINGDNIFSDPETLKSMIAVAETGEFDLVSNILKRTFPYGVTVEIVRVSFHRKHLNSWTDSRHTEHVTLWFSEHPGVGRRFSFENASGSDYGELHLALDTAEDLERTRKIFQRMDLPPYSYSLDDIIRFAIEELRECKL